MQTTAHRFHRQYADSIYEMIVVINIKYFVPGRQLGPSSTTPTYNDNRMKTCLLHENSCGQLQKGGGVKELGLGTNLLVTPLLVTFPPTEAEGSRESVLETAAVVYPGVCYAHLLPRDIAGEFTDDLSKLVLVFVFCRVAS
jgi:hypothetical protein